MRRNFGEESGAPAAYNGASTTSGAAPKTQAGSFVDKPHEPKTEEEGAKRQEARLATKKMAGAPAVMEKSNILQTQTAKSYDTPEQPLHLSSARRSHHNVVAIIVN